MSVSQQILDAGRHARTAGLQLPGGQADVWVAQIAGTINRDLTARYRCVLTPDELRQAERFHFEKDRNRYLITRALVRCVLSRYGTLPPEAWRFQATAFGRPYTVNDDPAVQGLSFNLSHSDKTLVMGVVRGAEIGIDVEELERKVPLEIAANCFSANETAQLNALPPGQRPQRFLELWTLKESYIKARGEGLSLPLGEFGFDLYADDRLAAYFADSLHPPEIQWRFWQWYPGPGSIAALCIGAAHGVNWQIKARRIKPFAHEEEIPVVMGRTS